MIANQVAPIYLTKLLIDKLKARSSLFEQEAGNKKVELKAGIVY